MTAIPRVRYARNGDFALAYQVTGEGPKDLVYLLFEDPTVVGVWFWPEHARFLERLASFSRLIVTDRRGLGCSDRLRPGESPTLEDLVDDLQAVMADVWGPRPTLFAGQETALVALLAAATHPDLFEGLILYGASPSWRRSDELPWEPSEDRWEYLIDRVRRVTDLRAWAEHAYRDSPSVAGNEEAMGMLEALSALSGGPEAWASDMRMFSEVDLRHLLPTIRVPTLILHRTGDPEEPIEAGRFLADRIPGAKLVELPGDDALPWLGGSDAVVNEIQEFMTGTREAPEPDRMLATVLFTDIVGSTEKAAELGDAGWKELLGAHHDRVRTQLDRFRGREVDTAGDGFLATFDGPARAVQCAREIVEAVGELGIEVRAGAHTGEIELAGHAVRGIAVHIGARVASLASAGEVLVSSTVKDLVAGSGLQFEDAGEHELKGVPDRWHLYRVVAG